MKSLATGNSAFSTFFQTLPRLASVVKRMRPTWHLDALAQVDDAFLKQHGIKGMIWDVDGTLTGDRLRTIDPRADAAFHALTSNPQLKHVILSNAGEGRYVELGSILPEIPILRAYRKDGEILRRRRLGAFDSWTPQVVERLLADGAAVIRKPSADLVQYALEELALEKDDVVMIGDQYMTDVAGANMGGVRSIKLPTLARETFRTSVRFSQRLELAIYAVLYGQRGTRAMNDAAHILFQRLHDNGMRHIARVRVTLNRSVLVSLSKKGILSVHEVYAAAPDAIIRAIVRFVTAGSTRAVRKSAQRDILEYYRTAAPRTAVALMGMRRVDRAQPGDAEVVEKLGLLFDEYNQRHFKAALPAVPIRLSGRMRTRLGHLTLTPRGEPSEITISRRHLAAHGWNEVAHTLLHEMVHLWQSANGQAVDHGPGFRAKARETGVTASARRWVRPERGRRFADSVDEFNDVN